MRHPFTMREAHLLEAWEAVEAGRAVLLAAHGATGAQARVCMRIAASHRLAAMNSFGLARRTPADEPFPWVDKAISEEVAAHRFHDDAEWGREMPGRETDVARRHFRRLANLYHLHRVFRERLLEHRIAEHDRQRAARQSADAPIIAVE